MDVLRPELYWVDGRCYRKNPSKTDYGLSHRSSSNDVVNKPAIGSCSSGNNVINKPYEEEDMYCDPDAPDDVDIAEHMLIEQLESGMYKTRCDNIPNNLFAVIVGPKAATKKRLEAETNTKIIIPFPNEKGDIVIRGQVKKHVIAARRRIEFLTSRARLKRDPTHFVCFPLISSKTFINKVREFQEIVTEAYSSTPICASMQQIFQDAQKMHLTISVLILLDNRERQLVVDLLKNLKSEILGKFGPGRKYRAHMKGIEIMNDDPSQVDVLYAKCITEDDTIQELANYVNEKFLETGLAKFSHNKSTKLHATLMNTRFVSQAESEDKNAPRSRNSFDARRLLETEKYREFDFGIVEMNEILVAVRYTTNPSTGFYNSSVKITFADC